ncbi:MAG TPA: DUF6717 family protein [Flavisolibacter sp.]|nr:DUF6717 family protein [Flavisolibacter sp.]
MNEVKESRRRVDRTFATIHAHQFIKEEGTWYIHLPEYLARGWRKSDLAMLEGTGKLLNILAQGRNKLDLQLSREPFPGAFMLELVEHCPAPQGGGIYLMEKCRGRSVDLLIWICDIALFVFGDMPEQIYLQPSAGQPNEVDQ